MGVGGHRGRSGSVAPPENRDNTGLARSIVDMALRTPQAAVAIGWAEFALDDPRYCDHKRVPVSPYPLNLGDDSFTP